MDTAPNILRCVVLQNMVIFYSFEKLIQRNFLDHMYIELKCMSLNCLIGTALLCTTKKRNIS